MLDVNDFIKERGGDPEKIRESQRRRHAPVEVVDEIISLWEEHRKGETCLVCHYYHEPRIDLGIANYTASQWGTKINDVQKQIGAKKKVALVGKLLIVNLALTIETRHTGQGGRQRLVATEDRPREREEGVGRGRC